MPNYICNKNADDKGRHEIHTDSCTHLPLPKNQLSIGFFSNCQEAINHMVRANPNGNFNFDGCYYCCYPCHKG